MNTVLESNKRLSESLLWKLQVEAYKQFGVEAWSQKGVPFYITSNPFTAKKYAHIVLGYIRDNYSRLDLSQPLYIFDLGAGAGRFAYLFLKELTRILNKLHLGGLRIRYIMTDIVSENFVFWSNHKKLKPFFDLGVLDYAFYDYQQTEPIRLEKSGELLTENNVPNPLIVIGNYYFDTIPQDLFRIKDGKLEEGRITLLAEGEEERGPSIINRLKFQYSFIPIPEIKNYYPDTWKSNSLLEKYRQELEGYSFLLPVGAFKTLDFFAKLSKQRLLLIAGDQAVSTIEQIRSQNQPQIALHGTFSISVNYHAVADYVENLGGKGLLTALSDPTFAVVVGILEQTANLTETLLAFRELEDFEPVDYLKLVTSIEEKAEFQALLALLKLGNYDPINFYAFFPKIHRMLSSATEFQKERLADTIERIWDNFYPISKEEGHFILNLGVLYFDMGNYHEALAYFERSLEITGPEPVIQKNIEICKRKLMRLG